MSNGPLDKTSFFICIKIHNLYEKDKMEEANVVYSLETTGPQLPFVKAHSFGPQWEHALNVVRTEETHFANMCANNFMQVVYSTS